MNPYILFFFIPLAWFVTVFILEAGSAVMIPICRYDKYRERMRLILGSLWAIIATSLVYLVVSLNGIFAPIMFATGEALYGLLLVLVIILAFHHYLIASGEGADTLGKYNTSKKAIYTCSSFRSNSSIYRKYNFYVCIQRLWNRIKASIVHCCKCT